ncbi:MAG: aspartate kinase [Myxococcota bacterium]
MITVVKFGGTSIENENRIRLAAKNLKKLVASGRQVVAVVSAQGNTTNKLVQKLSKVSKNQSRSKSYFEFLATGEKMSAHLLAMALNELGQPAEAITQESEKFPLLSALQATDEGETGAGKTNELKRFMIDEDTTRSRMKKYIRPLLDSSCVPVVAGFFIKDSDGNLVSLGRGGSDVTAFLLGKYLNCDEVIIVTDVTGVFSSDPREVNKPRILGKISAEDLALLARTGAQILHPNALRFKSGSYEAKIVHFKDLGKVENTGTKINGAVNTRIQAYKGELTLFTFTGKRISEKVGLFAKIADWFAVRNLSIHSLSTGDDFVSIYIHGAKIDGLYKELHTEFIEKRKLFTGLTKVENVGEVKVSNHIFVESPGIISLISENLFKEGINIIEMVTAHTDIVVYVSKNLVDKSVSVLRKKFLSAT